MLVLQDDVFGSKRRFSRDTQEIEGFRVDLVLHAKAREEKPRDDRGDSTRDRFFGTDPWHRSLATSRWNCPLINS